jgi:hypothetical protein
MAGLAAMQGFGSEAGLTEAAAALSFLILVAFHKISLEGGGGEGQAG